MSATILDVQHLRVVPSRASEPPDRETACEVLIVGGGMGGVAAALAAARAGRSVVLAEETDWLGGQMTAQGVSALDEHRFIETFGGTASYMAMRQAIRDVYRSDYRLQKAVVSSQLSAASEDRQLTTGTWQLA